MLHGLKHRPLIFTRALLVGLTLAASSQMACTHTGDSASSAVKGSALIPRQVFFENPSRLSPAVSPDGQRIAYLAESRGVLNVWVAPIKELDKATAVTDDRKRGIRNFIWSLNSDYLLYVQDKDGDENFHVYAVNVTNGTSKDLTPFDGVAARIRQISERFPDEVLIAINNRDPRHHDLYRVNILSGEAHLVQENKAGFAGFISDENFDVRLAVMPRADGGMDILLKDEDDSWDVFMSIPMEDSLTTGPIGLDKSGQKLYALDSRNRNTAALVLIDLQSKATQVLAENPRADASDQLYHPSKYSVQAVAFEYKRQEWTVLDQDIEADFAALRSVAEGDFYITSRTQDDSLWIVAYVMSDGPVRYYRYQRSDKKAKFLFTNRPSLEKYELALMHPKIITSRDGLNLVSYLTLPTAHTPKGHVRPKRPLPMVLLVHGGPWARDSWGLNSMHQWLASRGYAVLSVNFRGSTGFGKDFVNAGNKEWAGKMHDDLIDAVNWAIAEKIADKDRVAIMGGSYGGYATLVGLSFTPETFACGVDIVGPSNLLTLLDSVPPYWEPLIEQMTNRIGDHRTEEGQQFLKDRSPLFRAQNIQRPLLIGQGANDPRVKQAESDQIVSAMNERNIPVTYVLYPDEGHGFAQPENRISFHAAAEVFLASCLDGPYEPFGKDLHGSSITVPTGASYISGLQEALETAQ